MGVDFARRRSTNVLAALWPIWLINVGGSAHVGEEQLIAIRRIGILTGGGDVPSLNALIKSATYRRSENDIEIFGLRRGWERSRI